MGETSQEALKREIMEELATEIKVGELIDTIEYDYPDFHLTMECFWCEVVNGGLELKEHEVARWLMREELYNVQWLPADVRLSEKRKEKSHRPDTAAGKVLPMFFFVQTAPAFRREVKTHYTNETGES